MIYEFIDTAHTLTGPARVDSPIPHYLHGQVRWAEGGQIFVTDDDQVPDL